MEPINLAKTIVGILEDKIAEDILLLDLRGIADFTDFFVIATATSDRMLTSLAESVSQTIKSDFSATGLTEGTPESGWMVLDYGSVVVHLLSSEKREYYQLEELWNMGKTLLHLQ